MSRFYTNFYQTGNKIFVRGYDKGIRTKEVVNYKPYIFLPKKEGRYKTLEGKPVDKMEFDSIREAKDFVKRYDEVTNFKIFGNSSFQYAFIADEFKGMIDWKIEDLSIRSEEHTSESSHIPLSRMPSSA